PSTRRRWQERLHLRSNAVWGIRACRADLIVDQYAPVSEFDPLGSPACVRGQRGRYQSVVIFDLWDAAEHQWSCNAVWLRGRLCRPDRSDLPRQPLLRSDLGTVLVS